jgi:hypothetical protein
MGSVKIDRGGGMLPAWNERYLPDGQASFAQNTYLYSGAVTGWRKPKLLRSLTNGAAKYAYRIPTITQGVASANLVFEGNPNAGDTVTLGEITYTFQNTPVNPYDVLRGSTTILSLEALFLAINYGSFDNAIVGPETPANPAAAGACPVLGFPYQFTSFTNNPGANTVFLIPVIPNSTITISQVNCVPAATDPAARYTGVIYENVNQINPAGTAYVDIPSSLITLGLEAVGAVTNTTVTSNLPVPVTLLGGTKYWIGFSVNASSVLLHQSTTGTDGVSVANTYSNGPPNPFVVTNISGATVGGSTTGTLLTNYSQNQASWQIWGSISTINDNDAENTFGSATISSSVYNYINIEAPLWGAQFNLTPVAATGSAMVWLRDLTSFADITSTLVGGTTQVMDTTITGNSIWMEFLDQDTNVLRTPVVDDIYQRYYSASPSLPPQYNTYERIKNGQPPWILGVPGPAEAPILSIVGGGNPTQIGFPNSVKGSGTLTLQYTWWQPNGTFTTTDPGVFAVGGIQYMLYPIFVTTNLNINDIGVQISSMGASQTLVITGIVCIDNNGKPGDVLSTSQPLTVAGTTFKVNGGTLNLPYQALATFLAPAALTASTQYWVGAIVQPLQPTALANSYVSLSKADKNTLGVSVIANPNNGISVYGWDVDNVTGAATLKTLFAPTLTNWPGSVTSPGPWKNFPDMVIWADVSPGTGGAIIETRAYVTTYVTAYGEEGPPSPPALLDGYNNATWNLTLQKPLASDLGVLRNIISTNVYRTMASVQGGTAYFYVGTISANCTQFVDQVSDDVVALNKILPSTTWFAPPATLQGIISLPNGMFAGFRANEVWFCEPFRPHAWPAGYVMTTDYPIVGLGVVGNTVVAATTSHPHTFTGINPSQMTEARLNMPEPCNSRGSILSTEAGVYYGSVNGLVFISGANVVENLTQTWITREKWALYTPQKNVRVAKNVSTYFAFGTTAGADVSVAQQGFTLELSEAADRQGFTIWPQVGGHRIGLSTLTSPVALNIDNVEYDPWSGVCMLVAGGAVYYYDFTDTAPVIQSCLWRSKKFQGPHKDNFSAFRVWFDIPPGGPQTPPAVRASAPFSDTLPTTAQLLYKPGMFGVIRIIADGFYITERELRYSTELMRVSSQAKYTTWQIEYEGVVTVTGVKMATSVKELGVIK